MSKPAAKKTASPKGQDKPAKPANPAAQPVAPSPQGQEPTTSEAGIPDSGSPGSSDSIGHPEPHTHARAPESGASDTTMSTDEPQDDNSALLKTGAAKLPDALDVQKPHLDESKALLVDTDLALIRLSDLSADQALALEGVEFLALDGSTWQALRRAAITSLEESCALHEVWALKMIAAGWCYGEEESDLLMTSPWLRSHSSLPFYMQRCVWPSEPGHW